MENLFIKLKIINDLWKIILKFITTSHNNLLNKVKSIDSYEIIKYDSKLMIIKKKLNKNVFGYCAKYVKLDNMKWNSAATVRFAKHCFAM